MFCKSVYNPSAFPTVKRVTIGKRYITRNGCKTTAIEPAPHGAPQKLMCFIDGKLELYHGNGCYFHDSNPHMFDLVAEA